MESNIRLNYLELNKKIYFTKTKTKINKKSLTNNMEDSNNNIKFGKKFKNNYYQYIFNILTKIVKYLLIINIMTIPNLSKENNINYSNISSITLKVKQIGISYVHYKTGCGGKIAPIFNEIYINGEKQNETKNNYYFNSTDNEVLLIWKNKLRSTRCMFAKCSNISEIIFTNFDTSSVTDMSLMFLSCSSLEYLNLSKFNTTSVIVMGSMFSGCSKLTELNLSNFDTSLVTTMGDFLHDCSSLKYMDLSNFNTSNVISMRQMFMGCSSLKYLYLSNFDTSQVSFMEAMFESCSSLIYINFGNAFLKKNADKNNMFDNTHENLIICNKYEEWNNILNSNNWKKINIFCHNDSKYEYTCYIKKAKNVNYNKYICNNICGNNYYQINDVYNFNCNELQDGYYLEENDDNYPQTKKCYSTCNKCNKNGNETFHNCLECKPNYKYELVLDNNINCYDKCKYYYYVDKIKNKTFCTTNYICPDNYNKLIIDKNQCIDNCSNDSIYIYEYKNICYHEIPSLSTYITTDIIIDGVEDNFNNITKNDSIITEIFESYFSSQLINEIYNSNVIIYNNISNFTYQIENKSNISFDSLYTEITNDINNIINDSFINNIEITNDINNTINVAFINNTEINNDINNTINISFINNTEINNYSNTYEIDQISSIIINNSYINKSDTFNKSEYNIIIDNLLSRFNKSYILEGNDLEFHSISNKLFTLSSTINQKNNVYSNKTIINLEECEYILKTEYHLPLNETLYILIIEIKEEGMKIPKVEYELFYSLYNNSELIKLNLTKCKNKSIDIIIPIDINYDKNINKFNKNSKYYNDVCSLADPESKTDITLLDRQKEFIDKNMTLCEENCYLVGYNYQSKKVKCSCTIKLNLSIIDNIKFDKNIFWNVFNNININLVNNFYIKTMKCFKTIIKSNLVRKNIGFYIQIFILLLFIVTLPLFIYKFYGSFIDKISNIIEPKINLKESKNLSNIKPDFGFGNQIKHKNVNQNYNISNKKENKIEQKYRNKKIINKKNNSKHKMKKNNNNVKSYI